MPVVMRVKAIAQLERLDDDSDGYSVCYKSMTNADLEREYCLSGIFADRFPDDFEDSLRIM